MAMNREIWREKWLSSINELTSLELQKKSWLNVTNTNPHWSFVEFMCCYFEDLDIENINNYPYSQGWITKQEYEIIKEWHEALAKYNSPLNNDYYNEAILNDPKWLTIIKAGIEAKNKLVEIVSTSEKHKLTEEIDYLRHFKGYHQKKHQ